MEHRYYIIKQMNQDDRQYDLKTKIENEKRERQGKSETKLKKNKHSTRK